MRTLLLALLFSLYAAGAVCQTITAETEVVVDGKGVWSAAQIGQFDWPKAHILTRIIWVDDTVLKADVSIGPVVRWEKGFLKPYVGVDTDQHAILGALLSMEAGYGVFYFGEARVSPKGQIMLFHRLSGAVVKSGRSQLRIEAVQTGMHLDALSVGIEFNASIGRRSTIFLAPTFDCVKRAGGFAFGVRVF
jgi:hypothetical protein